MIHIVDISWSILSLVIFMIVRMTGMARIVGMVNMGGLAGMAGMVGMIGIVRMARYVRLAIEFLVTYSLSWIFFYRDSRLVSI